MPPSRPCWASCAAARAEPTTASVGALLRACSIRHDDWLRLGARRGRISVAGAISVAWFTAGACTGGRVPLCERHSSYLLAVRTQPSVQVGAQLLGVWNC